MGSEAGTETWTRAGRPVLPGPSPALSCSLSSIGPDRKEVNAPWEVGICLLHPGPSADGAGQAGSCRLSESRHRVTFLHRPCVSKDVSPLGPVRKGLVWSETLQWNAESFWNSCLQKTNHRGYSNVQRIFEHLVIRPEQHWNHFLPIQTWRNSTEHTWCFFHLSWDSVALPKLKL